MGHMEIEQREVKELLVDLSEAPGRMQRKARQGVREGARVINREMRIDATGHKGNWFGKPGTSYVVPLPQHVSNEMIGLLEAEIGIESKGAGKLAHLLAFGSVKNAPAYDYTAGPRRAMPEVERILADQAEESVLGGDGAE